MKIVITSLNVESISNVNGATSTQIRLIVTPESNDVIAVRNQVLEIDTTNLSVTANVDTVATGSASGVGVTTASAYTGAKASSSTSTSSTSSSSTSSSSSSSSSGY